MTIVPEELNVGRRLTATARALPDAAAIIVQRARGRDGRHSYSRVTFRELDDDSDRIARGLARHGVSAGTRLALLVRPGSDFISLVFALFKAGAVQVLIDPGMGRRNAIRCLAETDPDGFVAVPVAQALRGLLRRRFPRARFNFTVGPAWPGLRPTLDDLRAAGGAEIALPKTSAADPAAIIFTTGSTGPPKGVLYRHGNFDRQVEEIHGRYRIEPGGIDLACFPLFALFNCAMGVTTVVPRMDASRPARADPATLIAAVHDQRVTQSFASPAVWDRLGRYCQDHAIRLPTLRKVFAAGAPVQAPVLARIKDCIDPDGEAHTPYGATEALPIASIEAAEVLSETAQRTAAGGGVCVGRRFPGIEWKVVRIVDGPIASIADVNELTSGEIGELIVRGAVVTGEYVTRREANALAKIADGGTVWHRMGDAGYLDGRGRFWFCGRVAHRVVTATGTLFTIPCEAVFNAHPGVRRSALVGIGPPGQARPAVVLEPWPYAWPRTRAARSRLIDEAGELGRENPLTSGIDLFLIHRAFPVDIRHNAKIFREKLAVWAAGRVR
jgi:olefin beta-lactone synthetase